MREEIIRGLLALLAFIFIAFAGATLTGCRTTPTAGMESLVEARIIAAINAERNRWATELSQQIGDGLRELDSNIDAVEGGLQQVAFAAREYRRFVLELMERLLETANEGEDVDTDCDHIHNPFLYNGCLDCPL